MSACGGGSSSSSSSVNNGGTSTGSTGTTNQSSNSFYTVGGTVTGLIQDGLKLSLNGTEELSVPANASSFQFSILVAGSYSVEISQQPTAGNTCVISQNTGNAANNVTNVAVSCAVAGDTQSITIQQIEVAQVLSQAVGADAYQMLVPGRKALVRAYIYAPKVNGSNATLPSVYLSVNQGANQKMTCPTQVGATAPTVPIRNYQLTDTCWLEVNAEAIRSGLTLKVTADTANRTVSPNVASAKKIDLVMVPLTVNGKTGVVDADKISKAKASIEAYMPFSTINITQHAAVAIAGTDNIGSQTQWETALDTLNQLRTTENAKNKIYFGLAPYTVTNGSFTAGLGYCNGCGSGSGTTDFASIGLDLPDASVSTDFNWQRTMRHELGHNLSLKHTVCGGASDPDYSYPYSGGTLSTVALYDQSNNTIINPNTLSKKYDIMGYCKGDWFSDYHYQRAQTFMNRYLTVSSTAVSFFRVGGVEDNAGSWQIAGVLQTAINGDNTITLAPIQASSTHADETPDTLSTLTLQATTSSGRTLRQSVPLSQYADSLTTNRPFFLQINRTSPEEQFTRVEWLLNGKTVLVKVKDAGVMHDYASADAYLAAKSASATAETLNHAQVITTANTTTVNWDAAQYPWVNVVWVKGDERRALALAVQGGHWSIANQDLPSGGMLEIALSDGLMSRLQQSLR